MNSTEIIFSKYVILYITHVLHFNFIIDFYNLKFYINIFDLLLSKLIQYVIALC
jgi:hypothetical protein